MFLASPGGSTAVGPTSGGKITAFNTISTTPQLVAEANPQRRTISFTNPGPNVMWVAPQFIQSLNTPLSPQSVNIPLTPSPSVLGGCFLIPPNGGSQTFSGECAGAWQAFAYTGTTNALTVAESNI